MLFHNRLRWHWSFIDKMYILLRTVISHRRQVGNINNLCSKQWIARMVWHSMVALHTYVCCFLLCQFQFLLGIFKGLRIFVQLIFSGFELLLQCYQIIFELICFIIVWQVKRVISGKESVSAQRTRGRQRTETEKRERKRQQSYKEATMSR